MSLTEERTRHQTNFLHNDHASAFIEHLEINMNPCGGYPTKKKDECLYGSERDLAMKTIHLLEKELETKGHLHEYFR